MVSSDTKTELHMQNLDLEADPGQYACNGTNTEGTDQAIITLRVRNRLAALWPFLGIVAEVLVLVTIIFIYEKRRKSDDILDGELALCPRTKGLGTIQVEGQPPHPARSPGLSPGFAPPSEAGDLVSSHPQLFILPL